MSRARPEIAVAGIAFDEAGRVLLVQRGRDPGKGLWTVPGGRLELGETLAAGCARELREETGLDVEVGPLVDVVERQGSDPVLYHYVILDYLVRVRGGRLEPGSDVAAARWCEAGDLEELPLTRGLRPVLDRARVLAAEWV